MDNKKRLLELYKLQRELLMHCVGMSYRMQKALEIQKEIKRLKNVK